MQWVSFFDYKSKLLGYIFKKSRKLSLVSNRISEFLMYIYKIVDTNICVEEVLCYNLYVAG